MIAAQTTSGYIIKLNYVNNINFILVNSLQITFCIADMRENIYIFFKKGQSVTVVKGMAESLEAVKINKYLQIISVKWLRGVTAVL